MKKAPRLVGVLIVSAALLVVIAGASEADAAKPIEGKLSKPGYTVIALAASGKGKAVEANRGNFRIKPPAKVVTLHLRTADGIYAGPIVVGREKGGKIAILGINAGANLGKIKVNTRKGYAKVKRRLPKKFVATSRRARAKKGVPIGAGNFGRVLSTKTKGGVPGDRDLDGIPDALDVDDNGNLILDHLDHSAAGGRAQVARATASEGGCGPNNFYCQPVAFDLAPGFEETVNVNAGSAPSDMQATLAAHGVLRFPVNLVGGNSAELDCGGQADPGNPDGWVGGLSYCTRGGTGVATFRSPGPNQPFPGPAGGSFDADSDGFGTLEPPACCPNDFFLLPGATTAQIQTGDVLIERVTSGGTETQLPATLNFVFVTVPALASYSDAATPTPNSGTVSYPINAGGAGTATNGFSVDGGPCPPNAPPACVAGDVIVTLTFWRPQRPAISGSDPPGAQWMDIGHLTYTARPIASGGGAVSGGCPQNTFSSTDPNLSPPSPPLLGSGGLADRQDDRQSSPGNTLSYQLDLSQCLAGKGLSFGSGETQQISFAAVSGATDIAEQFGVAFKHK